MNGQYYESNWHWSDIGEIIKRHWHWSDIQFGEITKRHERESIYLYSVIS